MSEIAEAKEWIDHIIKVYSVQTDVQRILIKIRGSLTTAKQEQKQKAEENQSLVKALDELRVKKDAEIASLKAEVACPLCKGKKEKPSCENCKNKYENKPCLFGSCDELPPQECLVLSHWQSDESGDVCPACGGEGTMKAYMAGLKEQAEEEELACPECKGKGKIECDNCEGYGEYQDAEEFRNCPCCEEGYIKCSACKGEGTMSRSGEK